MATDPWYQLIGNNGLGSKEEISAAQREEPQLFLAIECVNTKINSWVGLFSDKTKILQVITNLTKAPLKDFQFGLSEKKRNGVEKFIVDISPHRSFLVMAYDFCAKPGERVFFLYSRTSGNFDYDFNLGLFLSYEDAFKKVVELEKGCIGKVVSKRHIHTKNRKKLYRIFPYIVDANLPTSKKNNSRT